jgi:hypothetical protein
MFICAIIAMMAWAYCFGEKDRPKRKRWRRGQNKYPSK